MRNRLILGVLIVVLAVVGLALYTGRDDAPEQTVRRSYVRSTRMVTVRIEPLRLDDSVVVFSVTLDTHGRHPDTP